MKKLQYLLFLVLTLLLSTNVFAEIPGYEQSNKALGEQYFTQGKENWNKHHFSKALTLLKESAKYNNAKASRLLGLLYFAAPPKTPITEPNTDLAIEYMSHAAELGDVEGKKMFRKFQLYGFGHTPSEKILQLRSEVEANVSNSNANKVDNLFDLLNSYLGVKQTDLRSVSKAENFANQLLLLQLDRNQKHILALQCKLISLSYTWGLNGAQKNIEKALKWKKISDELESK